MDVLGCSLAEVCEIMDFSLPAVKAALHRGRARRCANGPTSPDDLRQPGHVGGRSRAAFRLCRAFQCARFRCHPRPDRRRHQARFVNRTRMNGKAEVSRYFGNYDRVSDWRLAPGLVEGAPPFWCSIPPHLMRHQILHAAAMVGRQGRRHPRFPSRRLCDRGRGDSALTAAFPETIVSPSWLGFVPAIRHPALMGRCPGTKAGHDEYPSATIAPPST